MRDLIFSAIVLGFLPVCYRRPLIGLLMFSWLAYMRPQDLTWGFARYQRWSFLVAVVTVLGYFATKPQRWFLRDTRNYIMLALVFIISVGVIASGLFTHEEYVRKVQISRWVEYIKLVGVALFTTAVVRKPEHLRVLMWIIGLSFGFYGVKNGLAGVLSGGSLKVLRGPGGMLEDNNNFGLALVMALPVLLHLGTSEANKVLRRGALAMVPLTAFAVILTHSRGAFLSLVFTAGVLVWRSRNRFAGIAVGVVAAAVAIMVMPKSYVERIQTIQNYEEDGSAMGRIRAWGTAYRMWQDQPVLGVGLTLFQDNYIKYSKGGEEEHTGRKTRVAHNSYLQILAECGGPALLLYLLMIFLSLTGLWRTRRLARQYYNTSWIMNYATMLEASMVGFIIGSVFLNRATFDLIYHWVAITVVLEAIAREQIASPVAHKVGVKTTYGGVRTISPRGFGRLDRGRTGFRNEPALGGP